MATSLDMSLDDIIKSRNKSDRARGRGRALRGRGAGAGGSFGGQRARGGAVRRGPLRVDTRPSTFAIAKASSIRNYGSSGIGTGTLTYIKAPVACSGPNPSIRRAKNFPLQHDLFEESLRAAGITGVQTGTKLYVSNLDYGVTNEDIRELFSEIGELKRHAVHYDKNGRPSGSAEVVFARRSDAFAALKKYNNVQLDGKPMKIEIIGANSELPVSARVNVTGGVTGRRKRTVVMTPGSGQTRGTASANRGSGQRGRGGPGGRGRARARGRGGRGRGRKPPSEFLLQTHNRTNPSFLVRNKERTEQKAETNTP
ncbi:RNA recognition motif domain [Dillenia turbinata]|uniref:RNA recognition motif domain n=1 Tax=Dillenia turbinata TaxID=194707 RepID=A0AAN8UIV5_9MAGN